MSQDVVKFDEYNEPSPESYVKKAGIYMGCSINSVEFVPEEEKDGKKTGNYGVIKFNVPTDSGIAVISKFLFAPPKDTDIKFFDKLYKNGVAVRDLTPSEQTDKNWYDIRMMFIQLGMALGAPFMQIKDEVVGWDRDIVIMVLKFQELVEKKPKALFPNGFRPIDIKVIWQNSKSKGKSNLVISTPKRQNDVVFWATNYKMEDGKQVLAPSSLNFSQWELDNVMVAKYSNNSDKPKDDKTITAASEEAISTAAGAIEDELF